MEFNHYSVLRDETIENLNIRPDGIYVDGTLGGGGHSYEICKRLSDKGRLIGIDQDADAIKAASERLAEFKDRVTIVRSNYSDMKNVIADLGIDRVDGIILLGFFAGYIFYLIRHILKENKKGDTVLGVKNKSLCGHLNK